MISKRVASAVAIVLACWPVIRADDSIDSILASAWQSQGIQPASLCSDDEFLRRASLDIIGRIPTIEEIQEFRKNANRSEKIEDLLASREFARFWSEVWVATFNGYSNAFDSDREVLRTWLEQSFEDNTPYDHMVSKMITATGASAFDGPTNFLVRYPQDPAVKVCRLFVGVRLDCARCHDHPFDRWTQEDFRLMTMFFQTTQRQQVTNGNVRLVNRRQDNREVSPQFLTGARPRTAQWRDELALFITTSKPFARTYANRIWYHFMGRGIVDPPDDFNRENPPSVPELLEWLAETARENKFAIRPMIRLICNSRTYQLSSEREQEDPQRESVFAYRVLKPLTPEQTYDSAMIALGIKNNEADRRRFIRRAVGVSLDEDFSTTWEYRETVQALMERLTVNLPMPETSIEVSYLRILSRAPTSREQELCRGRSFEDMVFALVNSNEFFFNH